MNSSNSSKKLYEIWGGTPQLLDPTVWKSTIWSIKPHAVEDYYSEVQITLESYLSPEGELFKPPKGFDYSSIEERKVIIKLYAAVENSSIPLGMLEAVELPNFRGWVQWEKLAVGNLTPRERYIVSNLSYFHGIEFHGTGCGRTSLIANSLEEVLGII